LTQAEGDGQTEGRINKCNPVERAMGERGPFDLLRQRLPHAA